MRLSRQANVTECQDELLFKDYLVGDPRKKIPTEWVGELEKMDRMVINMLILSAFALLYRNHRRDWKSRLLEQCGNKSRWGVVIGLTLLGVFSASVQAAVCTVNNPFDVSDASPGNRVCETAPGNGVCTARSHPGVQCFGRRRHDHPAAEHLPPDPGRRTDDHRESHHHRRQGIYHDHRRK